MSYFELALMCSHT